MVQFEAWIGDCGCRRRKRKLNALSRWAKGLITGKEAEAKEELEGIIGDEESNSPGS